MIPRFKVAKTAALLTGIILLITMLKNPIVAKAPSNLIILPCHSVYTNQNNDESDTNAGLASDDWILASFQTEANDHLSFVDHIERSKTLLHKRGDDAILVLSGGYTKKEIELSESRSYFNLGLQRGWFDETMLGKSVYLEELARDSYENVLFSLVRFYQAYGKFPKLITIVGFGFKESRFVDLHLKTLGYLGEQVEYIGIGPDFPEKESYESVSEYKRNEAEYFTKLAKSEKKFAYDLFKQNPFGSLNSALYEKKVSRDPWSKASQIPIQLKSNSLPLNSLIAIDNMEIDQAMETYNADVKPYLPFFKED